MKRVLQYITILAIVLFSSDILAQTDTEFWFVVPEIDQEHNDRPIRFVFTTTDFAADITMEMPANPAFTPIYMSLPANTTEDTVFTTVAELNLFENKTVMDEIGTGGASISNKGIRITSTAPITCYYEVNTTNNSDIWSLKGSNGLGTDFYIPFQDIGQNRHKDHVERGWSSIEIIGTGGTTVIEIYPSKAVYRNATITSETNMYTVTLEKGEVYTLPPAWDATIPHGGYTGWFGVFRDQHIGGTYIHVQSGDPVAVVVKDDSVTEDIGESTDAPSGGWDIIADQWVPLHILGTEYVAMRGTLISSDEKIFAVATENNTRIWWEYGGVDTTVIPVSTVIDKGEQVRIDFPNTQAYKYIIANKKLSVLHVSGVGTEMGGAVLPPIDKCTGSTNVGFTRSKGDPAKFHMNIMVRTTAKDGFYLNGVLQDGSPGTLFGPGPAYFADIPGTPWSVARIQNISDANVPPDVTTTISNTKDVFHLGVINETDGGAGCRFGYFSDFNEVQISALSLQGGEQPSATPRACIGDSIQLFATGGTNYEWWPADDLSSTTISNPKTLVTGYKVYYVKVSGFCNQSDTASVSITPLTQPDANFLISSPSGCAPLDIDIRNLSTNVSRMYWDFNSTLIAGLPDQDTTIFKKVNGNDSTVLALDSTFAKRFNNTSFEPTDSPQVYEVKLKVKNTKCYDSLSTTITLYPEVTADFTLSDLDDTLSCNPAVVDFLAVDSSINEDYYKWNFGDGALSAAGDTVHEYVNVDPDNDVIYTARLIARSQWNCRDTAYQDFLVHPYLEGGFTIDDDEGCSPLTVRIDNISTGADSIFLDYGDGEIDTLLSFNTIYHLYRNNDGVDEVDTNIIVMRVKNDEGCEFTDVDTVLVYPEFEATYTIDGNNYTGCNSRTVTFTNTTDDGTYLASRYLWEFDDGTSMDTTNATIDKFYNNTTANDKTYNFRLTARSVYGCTDDTTNSIDIYRAYANFTVNNNEGCSPVDVAVSNISIGNQITTWDWDYGDTHTDNVKNPFPYSYTNNTDANITYPLTLEVTGTNGCSSSKAINITIYPQIKATYTIAETSLASCDSLIVDFDSDIAHPGLEPTTIYTWDFGDGASASVADPTHVYKNLASATMITRKVDLHVETPLGCAYDTSSFIDVYPMVNAKFAVDKVAGCSPLSVNAVATEYIGVDQYNWTYGDGYNPNVFDPPVHIYPVNPPGGNDIYTLRLDVEDLTGTCTDFATRTITVYDEVNADFNPKNSTDCDPYTVTFDNLSQNAITYKWDFDDGGTTSTQFEPTYEFVNPLSSTHIFNVELEATSDEGCVDTYTSTVNVLPTIEADFDIDVSDGCSPLTVTITNNYVGSQCYWYWDKDDRVIDAAVLAAADSTVNFGTFSKTYYNSSGSTRRDSLTLIVGNGNGCYEIYKRAIRVYSSIDAEFTYNPASGRGCNPLTVDFTNTTAFASTYTWDFADGSSTTVASPTHEFINTGTSSHDYTVRLTAESAKGCTDTEDATIRVYRYVESNFDVDINEGCSPLTVTITNNSLSTGTEWYWYWDKDDRTIDAAVLAAADSTVNYGTFSKTYINNSGSTRRDSLTLIVGNGKGCYEIFKRAIRVHSTIDAEFTADVTEDCNPLTVQFTNNTINGSVYNWTFDDGSSTTTESPSHKFINTGISDKTYTVRLVAESSKGCTDDEQMDIKVYSKVISSFSMDQSEGCPPFTSTIDNTSVGNASNTYQWFIDNVLVPGSPTDLSDFEHTYENMTTALKPYEVKLIATNPHGCTSEYTDIITAYEYIKASFSMDVEEGCTPLNVQFKDLSSVPTNTKYTWNFGDGASSGLSDPSHKFYNSSRTTDLNRTISLKVESANYCSDDTSMDIDIYHQPLSKFYIDKTSSCPPLQSTLTKLSEGEDTYEWRFGDGNTNTTDENLTYTWDNTDIDNIQYYNLELWVGTSHNCVDSSNLDLSVFPKVTADYSIDNTGGCSPLENVQFTNESTSPATQFFWSFGDGATTNMENPLHDFANVGLSDRIYNIYFRASSEYNCWDTITKQVTVYVQPDAEFYVEPVLLTYPDNVVALENKTNSGPFDYLWEFGDINNSTSTNEDPGSFEYEHWGYKIIELGVTSQTNSNCTDNFSDTILIQPPKVNAEFTTNIDGGCWNGGLAVDFMAESSAYAEEYTYEWDFGDGETDEGQNVTHVFENVGTYNVQLTAKSTEGAGEDYAYKKISVFANPEVSFEASPKFAMLDPSTLAARIKFYNTTLCNDTAGCAYTWDFGDGTTGLSRDVTHAYTPTPDDFVELEDGTKGIYYDIKLVATTAHGCKDSLLLEREVKIIGAGQIAFPNAFTPDGLGPAENETFRPLAEGVIEYELFVYNRWGELIFTTKDLNMGWDGTIDGEMAKPDVYVWKAQGKFTNGRSFEIAGDVTLIR